MMLNEEEINPIDNVETILKSNNWIFNRMNDEELYVELSGTEAEYSLYFMWDEKLGGLQLCCQYDTKVEGNDLHALQTIMSLNENMWMGHFDLPAESKKPCFRYTSILNSTTTARADQISNMVDIALAQCERFYPVFKMLASGNTLDQQDINLALMDTQGRS